METRKVLLRCIETVLKPVAQFCVSNSIGFQEFNEQCKKAFIAASEKELQADQHKVTMRRLATLSGIHRKEIARIYKLGISKDKSSHSASRILMRWMSDKRYLTKSGKPKVLSIDGDRSDFHRLVRDVSRDFNPGTVLFDLERIGAAERTKRGLKLVTHRYVSRDDWVEGFEILAQDMKRMIESVQVNVQLEEDKRPNFHATTRFTNLALEDLPKIQNWFLEQCSSFHQMVESYLARFDLDLNPDESKTGGGEYSLCSFTHVHPISSEGASQREKEAV